jgi:hypothetical protein
LTTASDELPSAVVDFLIERGIVVRCGDLLDMAPGQKTDENVRALWTAMAAADAETDKECKAHIADYYKQKASTT